MSDLARYSLLPPSQSAVHSSVVLGIGEYKVTLYETFVDVCVY